MQAEKLILDLLDGQTPAQLGRLAAQVVVTVDPDGAAKRRQYAEREEARVRFWRDNGGACALAAFGLPTDAALAANDAINDRAAAYKAAKIRPGARMDQLRVLAFLDLLNGITPQARITCDRAAQASGDDGSTSHGAQGGPGSTGPDDDDNAHVSGGDHGTKSGDVSTSDAGGGASTSDRDGDGSTSDDAGDDPGGTRPDDDGSAHASDGGHNTSAGDVSTSNAGGAGSTSDRTGDSSTSDRHQGGHGNDRGGSSCDGDGSTTGGPGGSPGGPAVAPALPALAARANLTLPLATLLGLAERPGAAHGLGPLDPALVRDLAAAAAGSPHSQWCTTITDSQGVAVAHGCAKPARTKKTRPASRDGPIPWAFTPTDDPGPPGGYGTWTLTLPGGRDFTVKLEPIPVTSCDHRHESRGYQPSDTLRHLVQVRDGECTFPPCSRHARESDFEHAVPYHQGGRTCACNGGARSRRCHRVKQSTGWTVTQPRLGWHQWTTPSGRTYIQGPMQYPA